MTDLGSVVILTEGAEATEARGGRSLCERCYLQAEVSRDEGAVHLVEALHG